MNLGVSFLPFQYIYCLDSIQQSMGYWTCPLSWLLGFCHILSPVLLNILAIRTTPVTPFMTIRACSSIQPYSFNIIKRAMEKANLNFQADLLPARSSSAQAKIFQVLQGQRHLFFYPRQEINRT